MTDWKNTPNDLRNRRQVKVTLSHEALAALDALAERWGVPRSRVVDRLALEAYAPYTEARIDALAALWCTTRNGVVERLAEEATVETKEPG